MGDKTDIELNCISQYYKRARVDMEWLSKIVIICENNPTYWNHLRFRFNSDCYEAGNLMSFLKKQRGNGKSPSVIDGLIEKVGMYAIEKKSVSAEQVSRNFSINSEQAENVIKQLETIGVLGKKNEDGTHTVMMYKAAFVKRIRGYQELAERMSAVAASKNANLSDVTISKKLIIEENDNAFMSIWERNCITTSESAVKKREEFEEMKKKTRNMMFGLAAVFVLAVAGVAAYKAMH